MKRRPVTLLIVLIATLAAGSAAAGSTPDADTEAADTSFIALAVDADRPANGLDLYDNIHRYMWRPVYMMATIDYTLPKDETGQFIFIRTWNGQAHKTGGLTYNAVRTTNMTWDNVSIEADALLFLLPGVELPAVDFEFVGVACGTKQFVNKMYQPIYALPVICILADDVLRIRPSPSDSVLLSE